MDKRSQSIIKEGSGNLQTMGVIASSAAALAVAHVDPTNLQVMAVGVAIAGASLLANIPSIKDKLIQISEGSIFRNNQLNEVKTSWMEKVKKLALGVVGASVLAMGTMGLSSNANAAQVVVDTPAQTYESVSSKASVFANDQDIAQEMMIETIKQMIKSSLSSPNDQALVEKGFSEMINNGMFDNALTLNDKKELILDNQILAENLPDSYAKTLADGNSDEKIVSLVAGVIAQTIQSDLGADNKLEQKIAQVLADHQSQQKPDDQQSIAKQGQQLAQDFAKYSPEIKDASLSM